jgi:hypothetical protein
MRSLLLIYLAFGGIQPAMARCHDAPRSETRVIADLAAAGFNHQQIDIPAKRAGTDSDPFPAGRRVVRMSARQNVSTTDETRHLALARGRDA